MTWAHTIDRRAEKDLKIGGAPVKLSILTKSFPSGHVETTFLKERPAESLKIIWKKPPRGTPELETTKEGAPGLPAVKPTKEEVRQMLDLFEEHVNEEMLADQRKIPKGDRQWWAGTPDAKEMVMTWSEKQWEIIKEIHAHLNK